MPLVQISLVEGRDARTISVLIHEVTEAIVRVTEVRRDQVRIVVYEVAAGSWGVAGVTKADGE